MKYLLMAVDNHIGYTEYEYAKITDSMMPNVKLSYLLRAAEHGCDEAEYEIGKLYYENGQTDEAIKHFEKGAKSDFWIKTRLGLLYCYTLNDWEKGMKHLQDAADEGYSPAVEAMNAINKGLNAQIIMGICDLFYYATNIIDNRADDYYSKNKFNKIDKKQKQEIEEKKKGQRMEI